ncbi:MAG: superoxide dismutase [Cu-Zn] SodC [Burkholderiaceae bacterium]
MKRLLSVAAVLLPLTAAADMTVEMHAVDQNGVGKTLGRITISENGHGTVFTPELSGLQPGLHGFHVHENPSCEPAMKDGERTAAAAAGGHFDPTRTGRHDTPWGNGHLGDLPALVVDADGRASHPVLAPRIKMEQLGGRALMIHAGGDNYSDRPEPLGGGGSRAACGVIEK